MTQKPDPTSKGATPKSPRKGMKGAAETARLFLDINESLRRTSPVRLSRYVE